MAINEIFSKRQKRLRGEFSDVYQYDEIPKTLRFQIVGIYKGLFALQEQIMDNLYVFVKDALENEYGRFLDYNHIEISQFGKKSKGTQILFSFAGDYSNTEEFLDVLEFTIKRFFVIKSRFLPNFNMSNLLDEVNIRFRESSVGYQLDPDTLMIIRVDSQLIHSEVVKPALTLLNSDPAYAGALDEFMLAHEHYRHRNFKDAIVNCGKSFESILKAIHEKRGWTYAKGKATASPLILSCVDKGLFPSYQQEQLIQLSSVLKSGVPTIRNNAGGHGDGLEVIDVPEHLVSYMIHLTASNLLFLANAEKNLQ
ncbi:hypothetical protein HNP10_002203 [Aeromonas veronii]|uniref:STM4504/CBY_0614 family protein n=1 Tax=Aeromonas veronii TaxID=654 RepID=UPI001620C8D0|nr:hypothetical protein [Aeromonas veronii]MCS3833442.1 hypothetical protein [Aeromonas veronii]